MFCFQISVTDSMAIRSPGLVFYAKKEDLNEH